MQYKSILYLSAVLIIGLFALLGCPKKSEVTTSPEAQKETAASPATKTEGAGSTAEMKSDEVKEGAGAMAEGLKPIYFDYDKSFIRDDAKAAMRADAEWLKANPKAKIRIEGNCDERGTKEYNQALGQRRAVSAEKYLTDMGVSGRRISLISYGKEKLVCTENNETCWQKNRRDDFVVVHE